MTTRIIIEDSQLVGNVTCTTTTSPCIQFNAQNIALRLNGFTITGPANPDDTETCQAASGLPGSDGIANGTSAANSQAGVTNTSLLSASEVVTVTVPHDQR